MEDWKTQTKIKISSLKADFDKDKNSISSAPSLQNENSKTEEKKINIIEEEKIKKDISLSWEEINWNKEINNNELFTNYTPLFEKRRISFLERLETLKKKAKTNYIFILITIFIWWLFTWVIIFINPQYHSLSNYKANVLNIVHKVKWDKEQINTNNILISPNEENTPVWTIEKGQINTNIDNSNITVDTPLNTDTSSEENSNIWTTEEEQIKTEREKVGREKIKEYFKKH
jgi:hypothetical protein